jgi:hypothetical protein
VIDREKYLERQRRYNRSAKGRARDASYRARNPEKLAETRARSNEKRIYVGTFYAGREGRYPYPREAIEQYVGRLLAEFRAKQAAEKAAWREYFANATPEQVMDADHSTELIGYLLETP